MAGLPAVHAGALRAVTPSATHDGPVALREEEHRAAFFSGARPDEGAPAGPRPSHTAVLTLTCAGERRR